MSERPPRIDNAPGLTWRRRKGGWEAKWAAAPDAASDGFRPRDRRIWVGIEATGGVARFIADRCQELQGDLDRWVKSRPVIKPLPYDGMLHSLVDNFLYDRASGFHKKRLATRNNYKSLCRRLIQDRGSFVIAEMKYRTFIDWDDEWQNSGVTMAGSLRRMFRQLISFGMTVMEQDDCTRAAVIIQKARFEGPKRSDEFLEYEQAEAIVNMAPRMGWSSIALAQALQWASSNRQKDIIGERQPLSEKGISDIIDGNEKVQYGARWDEIDEDLLWHHSQSKKGTLVEPPLLEEPLLVAELRRQFPGCITEEVDAEASRREGRRVIKLVPHRELLPASGPMILNEDTGAPYTNVAFRRRWRLVADRVEIPKSIKNMMTRAGTATEGTNGGMSLEIAAKALGHRNTSQTAKYSRDQKEKHKLFMRGRVADREARLAAKREDVA